MRSPMAAVTLLAAFTLSACGGSAPRPTPTFDEEVVLPGERPTLQMYLVLTADPKAMQGEGDVDAMWAAVHGRDPAYAEIFGQVEGVPGGYELDVELDYADLPHPQLPAAALEALIAQLPPELKARAEKATLAISLRSSTGALPAGGQIRLVGAAALFAARKADGVILDLLARRAWAPDDWAAELALPGLTARQVRVSRRKTATGYDLLSRGHPKYGAPDLQMTGIAKDRFEAARQRFSAAQALLLEDGGQPGGALRFDGESLPLSACTGVAVEMACVRVAAP